MSMSGDRPAPGAPPDSTLVGRPLSEDDDRQFGQG